MSACCLCNETFCKQKSGKGYQKRPLSSRVRCKKSLSVLESLKLFYNYNGPTDAFICCKCLVAVERKIRQNHGSSSRKARVATVSSAARTCRYTVVHFVICWHVARLHKKLSVRWCGSRCARKCQRSWSRTGFPRSTAVSRSKTLHGWMSLSASISRCPHYFQLWLARCHKGYAAKTTNLRVYKLML